MNINKNNGPPASLAYIGYSSRGAPLRLFLIYGTPCNKKNRSVKKPGFKTGKGDCYASKK